jgi:hypothetical protein
VAAPVEAKQPVVLDVFDPATGMPSRVKGVVASVGASALTVEFADLPAAPACWVVGSRAVVGYGDSEGMHYCETLIIEVTRTPLVTLRLRGLVEVSVEQRRKFLRIPARFPLSVTIVDSTEPEAIGAADEDCVTEDLSAGGMRFLTRLQLRVGDILYTSLSVRSMRLPSVEVFHLSGTVVRLCSSYPASAGRRSVACEFVFLQDAEQSRLVRLVQRLQPRY